MEKEKRCDECMTQTQDMASIPYAALESERFWNERQSKRMWVTTIVLILALFLSNVAWLFVFFNTETLDVFQDVEQQSDAGNNSFIGGTYNGSAED